MGNTGSNYQPISNVVELTPHEQAMKLKYQKIDEAIDNSKWALFIKYCCKNELFCVIVELSSLATFSNNLTYLHFKSNKDVEYIGKVFLGYYETLTEAEIAVEKRLRDIYGKVENEDLAKYPIHRF